VTLRRRRIVLAGARGTFPGHVLDFLAALDLNPTEVHTTSELLGALAHESSDVLLLDLGLASLGPWELIETLRDQYPLVEVLTVAPAGDLRARAEARRHGILECLEQPLRPETLRHALERALERREIRRHRDRLEGEARDQRRQARTLVRAVRTLGTLDRDLFLDQMLGVAIEATGAQGGTIWTSQPGDPEHLLVAAFRGLVSAEDRVSFRRAERRLPTALSRGEACFAHGSNGDDVERSVVYVPLGEAHAPLGLLKITDKLGQREFDRTDLELLQALAEAIGVGLANATRYDKMERRLLKDSEVPAYNLNYFVDYAAKEIYKARRYQRTFSLVTLKIDNFTVLEESLDPRALPGLVRKLTEEVTVVIRDSDVLTRVDDDEYFLLLPETDYLGALMCVRRILTRLRQSGELAPQQGHAPLSISIGSAAFPRDGDDYDRLLIACKLRAEEARNSLFRRRHLEELDFWDIAEVLLRRDEVNGAGLTGPADRRRTVVGRDGGILSCPFDDPGPDFALLQEEIALELARNRSLPGIVFLGVEQLTGDLPFLQHYGAFEGMRMKAYLLGERAEPEWRFPTVTPVAVPPGEKRCCDFLLYLSEAGAYGCLLGRASEERRGFHTSDALLVEQMIAKLQEHYRLQRQY